MERIERLAELFDDLVDRLFGPELDPRADRTDWDGQRQRVEELVALYQDELLPALDAARGELEDEIANVLETRACYVGLGVFAVLHVSGQSGQALLLLGDIAERSRRGDSAELFAAAKRDTDSAIELARLRHRTANGDRTARAALKRLAKKTGEKAIAAEALEMAHAPRPLDRAPPLWTLNGFGTNLYGSRDADPSDGSEIKTLCLSALFVPVFPLTAYRVIDQGDGGYLFLSKNRLSGFARGYRALFAAAIASLIAYAAINSYLTSPDRLAKQEIAAADAAREAGDLDQALATYEKTIDRYGTRADQELIAGAAARAIRIRIDRVASPLTAAELPAALGVIRAYRDYPTRSRSQTADLLIDQVLAWSGELEGARTLDAAVTLLAEMLDTGAGRLARVDERLRAVRTALAAELAPRRPVDALDTLIKLDAGDKAGELIAAIRPHPSLLREAAPAIEAWLASRDNAEIRAALEQARAAEANEARAKALEGGDAEALAAALAEHPGDHELTAALAELDRAAGKPEAAIERLTALGEPGWLTGAAQQTLASAHADAGSLEAAEQILGELLRYRMPAFREASKAYNQLAEGLRERLIRQAEAGSGPPAVMQAFRSGDESATQLAFEDWFTSEMNKDANLARLRERYQRHGYVVGASLALGTIKLRRANQVGDKEREALLADAERAFLAISADAVGLPSYHLGLGQVYHRLGKTAEGDRELEGLLSRGEFELDLAVSRAYRELGKDKRAIEISERVYNKASSPMREQAAHQLSFIVSDIADKEMWLGRADTSHPEVKANLDQVRAVRAAQKGDDETAAKLYRRAARYYERSAAHSSTAANNAAIAHRGVYEATGDRRELARGRAGLEASLRLEPGNALVVGNLAEHAYFEGWLELLSAELPTDALRLQSDDTEAISKRLVERGSLSQRAERSALLRRSLELTAQETILAPSSTSGWERAITWAAMRKDVAALERLDEQIARIEIDTSARAERHAEWLAGELDELAREQLDREIARREKMLAEARKARSRRGEAAARYLLGASLSRRGWTDADVETLQQAVDHLEAARAAWPELGDTSSGSVLQLAIVRAGKSSPEVEAMRKSRWREHSSTSMLIEQLLGDGGEPVRRALAADPAIGSAARWLASADDVEPSVTHWVIGVIAGEPGLVKRGAASLRERHWALAAQLGAKLDPQSKSAALYARLYAKPEMLDAQ